MKVFLVGGTGALGRWAIPALVAAGHEVTSTARSQEKAEALRRLGARVADVDAFDGAALRQAIRGADAVARLTTRIPALAKMKKLPAWEQTNRLRTEGARILVDACIAEEVPTYLSESIVFSYADGGAGWLDELSPVDDAGSAVLRAALAGEQHAARFTESGGRGIVLRFGGFYGPGDPTSQAMEQMIRRRMLPRIGSGENYRPAVYLPDAGRAVAAALAAPGGIYNVTDDDPVQMKEFVRLLAQEFHAPAPLPLPGFFGPLLFGHIWKFFSRSQRVSSGAFQRATGWKPEVRSAREGWRRIAQGTGERGLASAAAA
jgi:nucleoside-diphosphate-sugar epimerase